MRINKKETYSIEDLTKEELVFLFEVIDQLKLAPSSSPEAYSLAERFKELHLETFSSVKKEEPIVENLPACVGCEVTKDVYSLLCPLENIETNLCHSCYESRQRLNEQLQSKANPTPR